MQDSFPCRSSPSDDWVSSGSRCGEAHLGAFPRRSPVRGYRAGATSCPAVQSAQATPQRYENPWGVEPRRIEKTCQDGAHRKSKATRHQGFASPPGQLRPTPRGSREGTFSFNTAQAPRSTPEVLQAIAALRLDGQRLLKAPSPIY